MLGAISHTVPLLTALDYYAHGCTFALKSRPFLGTQRVLLGLAQETSRLRWLWLTSPAFCAFVAGSAAFLQAPMVISCLEPAAR